MCTTCVLGATRGQKRALDCLEVELWMVVIKDCGNSSSMFHLHLITHFKFSFTYVFSFIDIFLIIYDRKGGMCVLNSEARVRRK